MKKFTLLLSLLLLGGAFLLSCSQSQTAGTTVDIPAETEPDHSVSEESGVILVSENSCGYTVIRSDYAEKILTQASLDLKYAIEESFGEDAAPELKTDWETGIGKNDIIENNEPEILIGDTNRAESREAAKELPKDHYIIKWINNKLVILGTEDRITNEAVTAFIEQYIKPAEGDSLILPADLEILCYSPRQEIPLAEEAEMRVMTFNILGSGDGYDDGRRELIMETVLDYMPDIIGFQESNKTNLNTIHLHPDISRYYDINALYHPNDTTANYTLILFLKEKYTLVEGGVEWNRSRYTGTNTKSTSWAVIERIEDGQRFIVTNIHGSLWDEEYELPPGETYESMENKANGIWHIDNVEQVLENVAELKDKYGDLPVISVGDYNFDETHRAYFTVMDSGFADARNSAAEADTGHASYHSYVGASPREGGRPIDHIFYTPESLEAVKHVICRRRTDLDASDHCPVYVDFRFIK